MDAAVPGPEMVLTFHQESGDECTRRFASVTFPGGKEVIADVWIEFIGEPDFPLPSNLDGLVLLVLFFCMTHGGRLVVEGSVSASLVRSLRHFQEAWVRWNPKKYRFVEIAPAELTETSPAGDRAIAAFSGGIDSSFLVLQHTSEDLGNARYPLTDVMFAHGLDIPLKATDAFEKATERSREFLESVSLRLRRVRTNIRTLKLPNWEDNHGAILCGLLHQFSHEFSHGLLASHNSYDNLRLVWGSNPVIDPLLGSRSFEIVHDGCGYPRLEKFRRVAENPIATKSVRVCWEKPLLGNNCGTCNKCIGAQLRFLAVGCRNPECFDQPFDFRLIETISPASPSQLRAYEYLLEATEERHAEPWRIALQKRLRVQRLERGYRTVRAGLVDILGMYRR